MVRRVAQLVISCVILGIGVAGLLLAALGSDGYSTLINGLSLATGVPFVLVNLIVGVVLIALAWVRKRVPGLGTVVQRSHPQPGVNLTYIQQTGDTQANHDAGDQFD